MPCTTLFYICILFCFHVLYTMLFSYCSRDDDNPQMCIHLAGMVVCRHVYIITCLVINTYIYIYIILIYKQRIHACIRNLMCISINTVTSLDIF